MPRRSKSRSRSRSPRRQSSSAVRQRPDKREHSPHAHRRSSAYHAHSPSRRRSPEKKLQDKVVSQQHLTRDPVTVKSSRRPTHEKQQKPSSSRHSRASARTSSSRSPSSVKSISPTHSPKQGKSKRVPELLSNKPSNASVAEGSGNVPVPIDREEHQNMLESYAPDKKEVKCSTNDSTASNSDNHLIPLGEDAAMDSGESKPASKPSDASTIIELARDRANDIPVSDKKEILGHMPTQSSGKVPALDVTKNDSDACDRRVQTVDSRSSSSSEREVFRVSSSVRRVSPRSSTKLLGDSQKHVEEHHDLCRRSRNEQGFRDRSRQNQSRTTGKDTLSQRHQEPGGKESHHNESSRRPSIQERLGKIAGNASRANDAEDLRRGLNRRASERGIGDNRSIRSDDTGRNSSQSAQTGVGQTSGHRRHDEAATSEAPARPKSKTPDFSRRPDKGKYEDWMHDPLITPKSDKYFMHDDRESFDGRRSFRSRGNYYRGGQSYWRNEPDNNFGGSASCMERGAWQHDMFEQFECIESGSKPAV